MESWFSNRCEHITLAFLLVYGNEEHLVTLHSGKVAAVKSGPLVMPHWTFCMKASKEDWDKFWAVEPTPGYHDILALAKFGRLRIEGDLSVFMQNLFYFKKLIYSLGERINDQA